LLVPATHQAALLLLLATLICLGSWANTLKLSRWRFELFYFDFAMGVFFLSLLAALTLGTLGSELSYNDRIAVAGLRSQVFAVAAGFVFNLGNMLFVATISLIGISAAFPFVLGLAFLISAAAAGFHGVSLALFAGGVLLVLASVILAGGAARSKSVVKPGASRQAIKAAQGRPLKALTTGIIGGFLIGASAPLAESALWGDLGLGAYAGLLMFSTGLLVSTLVLNFFFMAVGIEGGRVTLADYRKGSARQHFLGLFGGALWAAGTLASLLAQSVPAVEQPRPAVVTFLREGAVLVAIAWGALAWREFRGAPSRSRSLMLASTLTFAAGLLLLAFRFRP